MINLKALLTSLGLLEHVCYSHEIANSNVPLSIKRRLKLIAPDAVYLFNQFPLIVFFDLSTEIKEESQIHKQVWSFDCAPIAIIIKNQEYHVLNAFNYVKNRNGDGSLQSIDLAKDELHRLFSVWNISSGRVWDWYQNNYYRNRANKERKKRVNARLFQNIKDVRSELTDYSKSNFLTENEANSLILRLIFIRYLIDREVKIESNYISGDTINEKRKSFCHLIKNPLGLNELFDLLNQRWFLAFCSG